MSERMTDERLAEIERTLEATVPTPYASRRELHAALVAERGRVVRLEAALTDLTRDAQLLALASGWPKAEANKSLTRAKAVLAEGATE